MGATLRVPFGIRDGTLYEPRQVPNGKACGCVCPACQRPLIAKQNHSTPHFAHAPGEDCAKALETAVHLAAKQLIAARRELRLPAVTYFNLWARTPTHQTIYIERVVPVDAVAIEPWLDGFRPDLTVTIGTDTYLVEIAVTHFVDEAKYTKIRERQIPALEIDASSLKTNFTFAALAALLFTTTYPAMWLYHPRIESLSQEARDAYEAEEAAKVAAIHHERERFRRYQEMPAGKKLPLNLRKLGMTGAQLKNLTTRVAWEKVFGEPRAVWQSIILIYLKREIEEQERVVDIPVPCMFSPEECWDWFRQVTVIADDADEDKPRIAFWKYLHHLADLGVIRKGQYRSYDIVMHYVEWGNIQRH